MKLQEGYYSKYIALGDKKVPKKESHHDSTNWQMGLPTWSNSGCTDKHTYIQSKQICIDHADQTLWQNVVAINKNIQWFDNWHGQQGQNINFTNLAIL